MLTDEKLVYRYNLRIGTLFWVKGKKNRSRKPLEKTRNARFAARQVQFAGRTVRRNWCPKIDAFAARTQEYAARTERNISSRREP